MAVWVFMIKEFGMMKKYIYKIFTVTALTLALWAGAGGNDAMGAKEMTVNGAVYSIGFKTDETSTCWYDNYLISSYGKDNKKAILLQIKSENSSDVDLKGIELTVDIKGLENVGCGQYDDIECSGTKIKFTNSKIVSESK